MTASNLLLLPGLQTFYADCVFGVYGIEHADHMAFYTGYPYSLHSMDGDT